MEKLKLAIIGLGRFGANYLNTLKELDNASVKWVCSAKQQTLDRAVSKAGLEFYVKKTTSYGEILKDREVDAVVIATPGSTHFRIAKDALLAGKHALVEKPVCLSSKDMKSLIKISKSKKRILMAGHLHLFNPGIQKLKESIKAGLFGKINFISVFHSGNGPVRTDMSALWDFMPHSVSIISCILEKNPVEISAAGASFLKKGNEDIVALNMKFPGNVFAISTGTWIHPMKKLEVVVAGEKLYAVFDDYAKENKLRYFDSVPRIMNGKIVIEDKGCVNVQIENEKPLAKQLAYFLDCIRKGSISINNGESALKITQILEHAQKSLKTGIKIKIGKL